MSRTRSITAGRVGNNSVSRVHTPPLRGLLRAWAAVGLLAAALLWSYWPTVTSLMRDLRRNQDYSVGQLVPLAALYLLWQDRRTLRTCVPRPSWCGGVGLILLAQAVRAYGVAFLYESLERYSLVMTVAGVVLLMTGWQVFLRVKWILLFLFLIVPLPGRVHNLIAGNLQGLATAGAVYCLELLGITVSREGNVILLNESVPLGIAEGCSGLSMLTAFIVVAATLAYVVNRPAWQKWTLVLSSIPVAFMCNLVRLVATAVLYLVASSEIAERFFHDFAGLTMMPLAVLVLMGELWIMSRLTIHEPAEGKS